MSNACSVMMVISTFLSSVELSVSLFSQSPTLMLRIASQKDWLLRGRAKAF